MIARAQHALWFIIAALAAVVAGCQADTPPSQSTSNNRPMRIVSMDYCADQFLLKLVDRERILALSKDAQRSFSYMREAAVGLPQVRASAEDVLALKPDLVVRSYGGGPNVKGFLERAGVPVLNVGWANDIASVKRVINEMATSLGEPERGAAVVAEMDARLAAIDLWGAKPSALYMTPAGVTSGPGSLVHEMLIASGLENYQSTRGWRALPLEQLVLQPPDMVAAAFFETKTNHKSGWSPTRHPVARAQLRDTPTTYLEGAWTSCGGWYLLDAIEALAAGKPKS